MANSLEIDLEEAFEQVMMKFEVRDYDRFKRVDEQEGTGRSNGAE